MDDTVVLIPAYKPTENLTELAGSLYAVGFRIVVVDDGSGDEYSQVFERTEAYATVIGYEENRGKGYALKYGLSFIAKQMAYFKYLITVDSDGQHSEDAVKTICEKIHKSGDIVLAERDSEKFYIPKLSRGVNFMLRSMYALTAGKYLRDTMAGLRAFEMKKHIDFLSEVPGDGFDYEINLLIYAAKRRIPIHTVKITEYDWQRKCHELSHYNIVSDAYMQIAALIKIGYPSICAMLINYVLTLLLILWFGESFAGVAGAVIVANTIGIGASVYLNNCIGYEENFDGALSYNRIMMGMLRFFAYLLLMEILCPLIGLGSFASLIISIAIIMFTELKIMRVGLDKKIRI